MPRHDPVEQTDYGLDTDDQLREAIATIDREEPRIAQEQSEEALEAARRQRAEMKAELERRSAQ